MPIYLGSSKIERVASSACRLQSKIVTPSSQTQVITPDDGYNGFNECTINGDSNLIAENIKSGVSIFGVAGTCAGSGSDSGFQSFSALRNMREDNSFREVLSGMRNEDASHFGSGAEGKTSQGYIGLWI